MPYTLNKSDGTALLTVADGSIDSSRTITYVGKNYSNYGEAFNENFVKLQENFARITSPSAPLDGQLWYDKSNNVLKVYRGILNWTPVSMTTSVSGTTNQITVTTNSTTGAITLSTPQNTHTSATPTFEKLTLSHDGDDAPLTVTSDTLVANLNADLLDGQQGSFYLNYDNFTNTPSLGTISSQAASSVAITGGSILDVTLTSGNATISGGEISGVTFASDNVTISGGSISGVTDLTVNGGINVIGAATLPIAQSSGLLSFENPNTRFYIGDGTGYSLRFSRRVESTTTDLVTLTDSGTFIIGDTVLATGSSGQLAVGSTRQISLNGSAGTVNIRADSGGWATGLNFIGSSGTNRGGFGGLGSADALSYYYIGPSYDNPYVVVNATGLGIGTVSPAAKLDVVGTTRITGSVHTPPTVVAFNASAMTLDCRNSNVFTVTLTNNVTVAPSLTNPQNGQTINWFITQDSAGSRTMTWPASFKWPSGATKLLSTAPNSVDLLVATYIGATGHWYATLAKGFV